MSLTFSIVTPVLNGAEFLAETIRSVTSQSHRDFDYTIIDAGSVDGSVEIAQAAARSDSRIRVVQRPGEPMYASVFWGLDQATGDIVTWINADDFYTPWAFAVVAQYLAHNSNAKWVSGLPGCWDAEGRLSYVRPEGLRPRRLIEAGWFHGELLGFIQQESIFFARSLYRSLTEEERQQILSCSLAGDFVLWKAFASRAPLTTIPSALGGFRRHGKNRSVAQLDEYMREVRAAGAVFAPALLRRTVQHLYRAASAIAAARLALRADAIVTSVAEAHLTKDQT